MKSHIWKVFEFSGWFILLLGIIFGLLYGSMKFQAETYGSALLFIMGIIFILLGEFFIDKQGADHKMHMIWQALSFGGAFALTVGIIWIVIQFLTLYESWFAIIAILAVGIGLILIGEAVKVTKK
ncbi:MAG: hypothetical protein ABIG20_00275 [archaeon]